MPWCASCVHMRSSAGNAAPGDVALCLSHSGNTHEVLAAATLLKQRGLPVFAISSRPSRPSDEDQDAAGPRPSPLARLCSGKALTYALPPGPGPGPGPGARGEPFGGAPTCSVVCMEALANALAVEVAVKHRHFDQPRFKRNHPGGALGRAL